MKIDLLYEIQIPLPHDSRSEYRAYYHCIRKLEAYRGVGCDRVLILAQASRIPHPAVLGSIELFGKHIIPHFDGR